MWPGDYVAIRNASSPSRPVSYWGPSSSPDWSPSSSSSRLVVRCEYRFYPGIPRDKICIFNRAHVLHGLYDVSARMRLQHTGPEYYDPKGYKTDLNVWSRGGTAAAEAAVSTWVKHFDDLWTLASVPRWRRSAAP